MPCNDLSTRILVVKNIVIAVTSELATPTQWSNCDPAQLDISDNGTGWRWFSRKYQLVTIGKLVDLNNRLIIFADSYWILICGINLMPPWTLTFVLSRGGRHEGADWHKVGGQHRDCGRHQEHKPAAHLHCTSIIIHEYFFCSQLVSFFCCLYEWADTGGVYKPYNQTIRHFVL